MKPGLGLSSALEADAAASALASTGPSNAAAVAAAAAVCSAATARHRGKRTVVTTADGVEHRFESKSAAARAFGVSACVFTAPKEGGAQSGSDERWENIHVLQRRTAGIVGFTTADVVTGGSARGQATIAGEVWKLQATTGSCTTRMTSTRTTTRGIWSGCCARRTRGCIARRGRSKAVVGVDGEVQAE